ncbi:MAG: hypothetical protein LUC22_01335 [Prevotella sp.]|nr:hypothetical protein [Prevotella sp.]
MINKKSPTKRFISEYIQRELQGQVVGYFATQFKDDFKALDPKERIDTMIRLAPYVYARLEATKMSADRADTPTTAEKKNYLREQSLLYENKTQDGIAS